MTFQCEQCGGAFDAPRKRRFCDRKCEGKWAYRHPKFPPATCGHCGETFTPKAEERTKYCSRACAYAEKTERAKGKAPYVRKSTVEPLTCAICFKAFLGRRGTRYCYSCRTTHGTVTTYVANCYTIPGDLKCAECGKNFSPEYGDKHRTYCSESCYDVRQKRISSACDRARRRGCVVIEAIDPRDVYEAQGWSCAICGLPMLALGTYPHGDSPSVDHIHAVGDGGQHTRDNVRGAHLFCNWQRHYGDWPRHTAAYQWQRVGA